MDCENSKINARLKAERAQSQSARRGVTRGRSSPGWRRRDRVRWRSLSNSSSPTTTTHATERAWASASKAP
eukprot:scaffold35120_cov124-Isochrysis_galbana.AAC.1